MSLGEELKELSGYSIEKNTILKELKPILKTLAKNHQKGCEIIFSNINPNTVKDVLKILKDEKISVYNKSEFADITEDYSEDDTWILVWDDSLIGKNKGKEFSPCRHCSDSTRISCCGCSKYYEWKGINSIKETKYIKYALNCVSVTITINSYLCVEII